MGIGVRIAGYACGTAIILFGLFLINEFILESSSQKTAPVIDYYPMVGVILIVIGGLVGYVGHRYGKKKVAKSMS
jgi:hypothetical protein